MGGFKMRSGNKPGFKNMGSSPAKQNGKDKNMCVDGSCPVYTDEEKKAMQDKLDAQIKGTYVETDKDIAERKKRWRGEKPKNRSKKKPTPAKATNPVEGKKKKPDFQKYDETNPDQREKSGSIEIDGKTRNYTLTPSEGEGGHLQYKVNWEKDEPVDTKTEENTDKKKKKRKKDTIFRDTNRDGTVVSRAAKKIFTRRKKGRRIKTKNLVSGGWNITNPWTGRTN